ncbi:hypothetical protein JHK87_053027 [Glycine soja]|nr:hypothetical protein JHK87_053027 [Glycine soja]
MNLIPIDETVSTDSEIYSIVSWSDYTSEEEEVNTDYNILNEFTRNEYANLYPVDDKYNHYGEILDDLGYNLMFKIKLNDCEHEIQFHIGPDLKECHFCKRYPRKTLRTHYSLCYKNFYKTCVQTVLKTEFPNFKKENDSGNKIMNYRISTLEIRLNKMEKTIDFLYENFEKNRNNLFSEEHTSGLMTLQNMDCIPIICNKKKNKSLRILVKINFPKINNFDQTEVILQALVDTVVLLLPYAKVLYPNIIILEVI